MKTGKVETYKNIANSTISKKSFRQITKTILEANIPLLSPTREYLLSVREGFETAYKAGIVTDKKQIHMFNPTINVINEIILNNESIAQKTKDKSGLRIGILMNELKSELGNGYPFFMEIFLRVYVVVSSSFEFGKDEIEFTALFNLLLSYWNEMMKEEPLERTGRLTKYFMDSSVALFQNTSKQEQKLNVGIPVKSIYKKRLAKLFSENKLLSNDVKEALLLVKKGVDDVNARLNTMDSSKLNNFFNSTITIIDEITPNISRNNKSIVIEKKGQVELGIEHLTNKLRNRLKEDYNEFMIKLLTACTSLLFYINIDGIENVKCDILIDRIMKNWNNYNKCCNAPLPKAKSQMFSINLIDFCYRLFTMGTDMESTQKMRVLITESETLFYHDYDLHPDAFVTEMNASIKDYIDTNTDSLLWEYDKQGFIDLSVQQSNKAA